MQFILEGSKMVRSYLDLTIKFHDYSNFFLTAFNVAMITPMILLRHFTAHYQQYYK